jgi:hypothetical protein
MDSGKTLDSLHSGSLWIGCLIGFGLGVVGALVHALSTDAKLDKRLWRGLLAGGVAAVAVLSSTDPAGIAFVGGSLVAGYAGKAILDGLGAKLTATVAQHDLEVQKQVTARAQSDALLLAARVAGDPTASLALKEHAVAVAGTRVQP